MGRFPKQDEDRVQKLAISMDKKIFRKLDSFRKRGDYTMSGAIAFILKEFLYIKKDK